MQNKLDLLSDNHALDAGVILHTGIQGDLVCPVLQQPSRVCGAAGADCNNTVGLCAENLPPTASPRTI